MNTTANTAKLMARLVDAETTLHTARREEDRTARLAANAAARAKAARTDAATARRELAKATRTGNGIAAATRRAETRTAKADTLTAAAKDAKATAAAARRAARAAARRLDNLGRRAAISAARTVEAITHRLGETTLSPAAETDRTLNADELPTVEEIETRAAQFADLDQRAKDLAKQADGIKVWLRTLPVGTYGRVVIARNPGRSVLDSAQIALDYAARGQMPPRKATRTTFKVDATALLAADLAPAA